MGIFDTLGEIFGGKKDITGQRIQLGVCMMGPRAVGKTSILTSIFHESGNKLIGSKLYFNAIGQTSEVLEKGYDQLSGIFDNISDESATPPPGVNASKEINIFEFQLGLKGSGADKQKRSSVDINITDFPGEFVDEKHPQHMNVVNYINDSHVIMVAIDTVHLMEEDGMYNEARNRSSYLCDKISNLLDKLPETERKLILLVPLKCEKYAIEGRWDELDDKVKKAYEVLIKKVQEEKFNRRIGLYITPIQTLGGVKFDKFGRDEFGKIIVDPNDNCPQQVLYKYHRLRPDQNPIYMPAFCVQPLYYLIAFALSQYKFQKDQGGVLSTIFKGICGLFSSDLKFYEACQNLVANIKTNGHGFSTINNQKFINN